MPRLVVVLAISMLMVGCTHASPNVRTPADVERALRAEDLAPDPVLSIGYRISNNPGNASFTNVMSLLAGGKSEKAFTVEGGRTVVGVYASVEDARRYSPVLGTNGIRARNVVAVSLVGGTSDRLRSAFARLR